MRTTKAVAALLATVLCLAALVGCRAVRPADDRTVVKLGGEEVVYDYFRYVFMNCKRDIEAGDKEYWTKNGEEGLKTLRAEILTVLRRNGAILSLAKEHKISLTGEEKKEIRALIDAAKKELGREEYQASLEESFLTEYMLIYVQELTAIWDKLYTYVTSEQSGLIEADDATIEADIPKSFRRIRYVFIEKDGEDDEEAKRTAEDVLAKALAGDDFDQLIEDYGEDETMEAVLDDGYYYTLSSIHEEMEKAVEALAENEIRTELLELPFGYFIVERLPLDEGYINENFEDFRTEYCARIFNNMLNDRALSLDVEYTDLFYTLTVDAMS